MFTSYFLYLSNQEELMVTSENITSLTHTLIIYIKKTVFFFIYIYIFYLFFFQRGTLFKTKTHITVKEPGIYVTLSKCWLYCTQPLIWKNRFDLWKLGHSLMSLMHMCLAVGDTLSHLPMIVYVYLPYWYIITQVLYFIMRLLAY